MINEKPAHRQLHLLKRSAESWLEKTEDKEELKRIKNWVAFLTKAKEREKVRNKK